MTYTEELKKAKENNIDILTLTVANEVESLLNGYEMPPYTETAFERACAVVEANYMKADINISLESIVLALLKKTNNNIVEYDNTYGLRNIGSRELFHYIDY